MEYAKDGDLLQYIEKHKREKTIITEEEIWDICRQIS
jgi:serine/threonine protein kinase